MQSVPPQQSVPQVSSTPSNGQQPVQSLPAIPSPQVQQPFIVQLLPQPDKKKAWWEVVVALAVPLALIWGIVQFGIQQQSNAAATLDQQQQTTLDTYLDRMSDLLVSQHLANNKFGSEYQNIARARTLAALQNLSAVRKGILLKFLYDSKLIVQPKAIVDLYNADLKDTSLTNTDLKDAYLPSTDLSGANLSSTNLSGANLSSINLLNAKLKRADLSRANLSDAQLNGADLSDAQLNGADLNKANLSGADLRSADLSGADLNKANLSGADLRSAVLTQEQVNQAITCRDTITPKGITHSQVPCSL